MKISFIVITIFYLSILTPVQAQKVKIAKRKAVSQYGITWTFDKPAMTGQFITGDWWVIGPVKIISISPKPGPVRAEQLNIKSNRWNDTSLKLDTTMRNGSMIIMTAGRTQGYDSRSGSFNKKDVIQLPLLLNAGRSLISSISNTTLPVDNFCKEIMWDSEKKAQTVMKAAAVLTCLQTVPAGDAFRPPYAGTSKPIFTASQINWNLLPSLQAPDTVPSWPLFERYFERPWIDHLMSWEQQELVPNENGPNYGREHARLVSIASLMTMTDVPLSKKEKLVIRLIQRGIDLYGLAMAGGYWNEGGGHSSGRKWPILYASIMLQHPELASLPATAVFHEDTQTYYGKGWFGQNVLWQMIYHHGRRTPYEEKPPQQWEKWDNTSESYRICCNAVSWTGSALAARYLKAIKLWKHDAYFDYIERWMREDDPYKEARGKHSRPRAETTTSDPFVTEMWKRHRKNAPAQEMSGIKKMWMWKGNTAEWLMQE